MKATNLLVLCARNRVRSPTAEQVFAGRADIIFVMERAHRVKLQRRFRPHLKRARVIRLDLPDGHGFMQPELLALPEKKVGPVL